MTNDNDKGDLPLEIISMVCEEVIGHGCFILQKWTCRGCGQRITGKNVNAVFREGSCDHCNHVTDITKHGCGFVLIRPSHPMTVAEVEQALGLSAPGIH